MADFKIKNGLFTTEFLTTVITQVVGLLVISGIIAPEQQSETAELITNVIVGIMSLITAIAYIKGRNEIKKVMIERDIAQIKAGGAI